MLPLTFLGVAVLASLDRMPKQWRRLPVLTELARLAVDSRRILFAPGTAVPLLLLSILSHALAAGARVLADLARQPDRATVLVRGARKRGS